MTGCPTATASSGSASFSEATDPPVFPAKCSLTRHRTAYRQYGNTAFFCCDSYARDRLSSAVAHDSEFVRPGLSARREPQSQPYADAERRARRKPKDQNDMGPGREEGLFGRNK